MQIVDCIGTPKTRGHTHGETLRSLIADALDRWEAATVKALGPRAPADFSDYYDGFLSDTRCLQQAKETTPDLFSELQTIAEGADQPFNRIAAYNLMDEQWWYDSMTDRPPPGCSLVASPSPGGTILAQNMDLPGHMTGSQVALRLGGPDMPETIALSAAGLLGLTGANQSGLAIGVNTLLSLNHNRRGLPVAFALRHALAAPDRAKAVHRLSEIHHASGQHYALVDRHGFTSLECSAAGCVQLSQNEQLLHANHPLASDDVDLNSQARLDRSGFNASSHKRQNWLGDKSNSLGAKADIRALFDDDTAPLCMRPETNNGSATFASVLYDMTKRMSVHMRAGIAGTGRWQTFVFG